MTYMYTQIKHTTCIFGSHSFAIAAPTTWNTFPLAIRSRVSTHCYRRQLKIFFYNLAIWPLLMPRRLNLAGLLVTLCVLLKSTYLLRTPRLSTTNDMYVTCN